MRCADSFVLTHLSPLHSHAHRAEFEASHGTVADLWQAHLDGKETSMNPLGMVEALLGAMSHRYGAMYACGALCACV